MTRTGTAAVFLVGVLLGLVSSPALCQAQDAGKDDETGQSRESMANDQTAAQWTFLLHRQWMDYHDDEIAPGTTRPEGIQGFWQVRMIMPIPKSEKFPISLFPRVNLRWSEAAAGHTGFGGGDIFVLAIAAEWSTGRFGIGPLVTLPASDERLGLTEWTYGLSLGITERFFDDRLMLFAIVGQTWGRLDPYRPEAEDVEAALAINPVLSYQVSDNWYVGTGDLTLRYDWDTNAWLVPVGLRVGRLWVREGGTWNAYVEYQTNVVYRDWPGSASSDSIRLSLGYSIPVR